MPSPVAGEIVEILVAEGDTVPIGARLAVITESDGEVGRTRASGRTRARADADTGRAAPARPAHPRRPSRRQLLRRPW